MICTLKITVRMITLFSRLLLIQYEHVYMPHAFIVKGQGYIWQSCYWNI